MADNVVTRKRRRYAVDPCLGYYIYAASKNTGGRPVAFTQSRSSDSEKYVIPTSFDAEREMELPCATYLTGQATSVEGNANGTSRFDVSPPNNSTNETPNQNVLTVEAFIKQTLNEREIKTRKTRTYEKKHRVQGAIEDNRHITSTADGRLCGKKTNKCDRDGEENNIPSSKTSRKKFVKARRKPLKERLYAAAVSTYGVPDAYYSNTCAANGVLESSRVPLHFLPGPQIHPLGRKTLFRSKSLLVDPRKSAAMQKARFACRNYITELRESGVLTNTLDVMPLSKWNLSSKNGGHIHRSSSEVLKKRKQRNLTEDTVLLETTCPPLAFVSFQEAEEKYDSMFSSRRDKSKVRGKRSISDPDISLSLKTIENVVPNSDVVCRNQFKSLGTVVPHKSTPPLIKGYSTANVPSQISCSQSNTTGPINDVGLLHGHDLYYVCS